MPLPQEKYYTVEDYFNIPDDIHAELINGQLFYMATPSTQLQRILGRLYTIIHFEGNMLNVQYSFDSVIKVNIYENLLINFFEIADMLNI